MRTNLMNEFKDRERLLRVIWQRRTNKVMYEVLKDSQKNGDKMKSLSDMESIVGPW